MSGAAKTFSNSTKTVFTNPKKANFGNFLNVVSPISSAFTTSRGDGPQQLATEDPKLLLAQSGGAPLLTQIALGASVDDALAGYFGRSKGEDWNAYYENLNPDEKAAIDGVRKQLNDIQSNTELRNQAVKKLVDDYPNVVAQIAPRVKAAQEEAFQQSGKQFDQASQGYLDYALRSVGAKYAAGGQLSSGAMVQATADSAAKLGLEKLNYQTGRGDVAYGREYEQASNELLGGWQAKYNEANALRGFQQTMLGQGVQQGFSAQQAYLQRKQSGEQFNATMQFNADQSRKQEQQAMWGALGGLAGTVGGAMLGGPAGAAVGGAAGKSLASGYGSPVSSQPSGSYYGWQPAGNPRLNVTR